jgi:hypothetical protein
MKQAKQPEAALLLGFRRKKRHRVRGGVCWFGGGGVYHIEADKPHCHWVYHICMLVDTIKNTIIFVVLPFYSSTEPPSTDTTIPHRVSDKTTPSHTHDIFLSNHK